MRQPAIQTEWERLKVLRQAVRDAPTCPTRIQALCNYQGELHRFMETYGHAVEVALAHLPARK